MAPIAKISIEPVPIIQIRIRPSNTTIAPLRIVHTDFLNPSSKDSSKLLPFLNSELIFPSKTALNAANIARPKNSPTKPARDINCAKGMNAMAKASRIR